MSRRRRRPGGVIQVAVPAEPEPPEGMMAPPEQSFNEVETQAQPAVGPAPK